MIRRSRPLLSPSGGLTPAVDPAGGFFDLEDTWHHAGYVAEMAVWDEANRVKDRHDEKLDAMRVHNGMTLDEFLAQTQK